MDDTMYCEEYEEAQNVLRKNILERIRLVVSDESNNKLDIANANLAAMLNGKDLIDYLRLLQYDAEDSWKFMTLDKDDAQRYLNKLVYIDITKILVDPESFLRRLTDAVEYNMTEYQRKLK